jgi:hypothetical protein
MREAVMLSTFLLRLGASSRSKSDEWCRESSIPGCGLGAPPEVVEFRALEPQSIGAPFLL